MTAMEIHDAIGDGMVIVLTPFAIAAALVAVFAVGVKVVSLLYYGSDKRDSDVIGSHLLSADGKRWDFSKSHSDEARAQNNVSAYDDPGAQANVKHPDPEDDIEIIPEDDPEEVEAEVIDFTAPDYGVLKQQPVKALKPKLIPKW